MTEKQEIEIRRAITRAQDNFVSYIGADKLFKSPEDFLVAEIAKLMGVDKPDAKRGGIDTITT
jgi:hypothetical protein